MDKKVRERSKKFIKIVTDYLNLSSQILEVLCFFSNRFQFCQNMFKFVLHHIIFVKSFNKEIKTH